MKKQLSTWLLLIVAIALVVGIPMLERARESPRASMLRGGILFEWDRRQVEALELVHAGRSTRFERRDWQWWLTQPFEDRADPNALHELFTALETLAVEQEFALKNQDAWAEYGLSQPRISMKVELDDRVEELWVGRDSAYQALVFARHSPNDNVLVIQDSLRAQILREPESFRDRRVLPWRPDDIIRVLLRRPGGEIELASQHPGQWDLVKPQGARANTQKVNAWLAQVAGAQASGFVHSEARGDMARLELVDSLGTIKVQNEFGQELELAFARQGRPTSPSDTEESSPATTLLVSMSDRQVITEVSSGLANLFDSTPRDFRDPALARIEPEAVDRIHIASDGKEVILHRRDLDSWEVQTEAQTWETASPGLVQILLSLASRRDDTEFIEDSLVNEAEYGLRQSSLSITWKSFLSEQTLSHEPGESPLATVVFGSDANERTYAKLEGEPFIVSIPSKWLLWLPREPQGWVDDVLQHFDAQAITSIRVEADGQVVALELGEGEQWTIKAGQGVLEETALTNYLGVLAHLNYWPGDAPADAETRFDEGRRLRLIEFEVADETRGEEVIIVTLEEWVAEEDGSHWYALTVGDELQRDFFMLHPLQVQVLQEPLLTIE